MSQFELFHRIADLDCAAVRRRITELALADVVRFRNVDTGAEALADLNTRTGADRVPSLWVGDRMLTGRGEILEFLEEITTEPFPELLENFDSYVDRVWQDLQHLVSTELHAHIQKIQFLILDEPTPEILAELPDDLNDESQDLCGLMFGTPLTEASVVSPSLEPARIYLFRWAIMDQIDLDDPNPEATLKTEIAITMLHEIGHFFGLSEADLDRLGYG